MFKSFKRPCAYLFSGSFILCALLFLINVEVQAQKDEIGAGLGGFNYTGDLSRDFQISNVRPGGTVFYRRNFNNYLSGKISLSGGALSGSDRLPYDALAQQRDTAFQIGIFELSGVVEYYFLDYKENINLLRWSPYFFIGAGGAFLGPHEQKTESYSSVQPVIPFGLGFKYILNREWHIGLEAGIRKTFTDYIDNISGSDLRIKDYAYGDEHTADWYYFIGLSLSYTFYTIPCPYQFN